MLDFDDSTFKEVKYWAFRALKRFNLQGFLILKSSENNYHVVFDRRVTWSENMRVVAWISLLSRNKMLERWFIMQCIKKGPTLRISQKNDKPPPRIVFRHGRQRHQIRQFLIHRNLVRNIINRSKDTLTANIS